MTSGLAVLKEMMNDFPAAERKAAQFIVAEPRTAVFCTITELARRSETSAPAIVRLCKRAGISGYKDLQRMLARDIYSAGGEGDESAPNFDIESGVSAARSIREAVTDAKKSIDRLAGILSPAAVDAAADLILGARSVAVFGIGASGLVALDFQQKLLRLGIPCVYATDSHLQITDACGLSPNDVAVAFSYSGETQNVIKASREAKISGAKLIVMTRIGENALAKLADLMLPLPAVESVMRRGASAGRLVQFVVVDALYGVLVSRESKRAIPLIERSMLATHPRKNSSTREPEVQL